MNKENKGRLETLLKKVATVRDLEICSLNVKTNQNPIVIEIIIKKTNGEDISLNDCTLFNGPASEEIENLNLLNCKFLISTYWQLSLIEVLIYSCFLYPNLFALV